jgi:hypothetical protein
MSELKAGFLCRFECGCVGVLPELAENEDKVLLLKSCTNEFYTSEWDRRDFSMKYEVLSASEHARVLAELRELISDGYKLRELRRLLREI